MTFQRETASLWGRLYKESVLSGQLELMNQLYNKIAEPQVKPLLCQERYYGSSDP